MVCFLLLSLQDGVSRIHSSRRVFDAIKQAGSDVPVLHHIRFAAGTHRCAVPYKTLAYYTSVFCCALCKASTDLFMPVLHHIRFAAGTHRCAAKGFMVLDVL
jgi:hypothetical protein